MPLAVLSHISTIYTFPSTLEPVIYLIYTNRSFCELPSRVDTGRTAGLRDSDGLLLPDSLRIQTTV